MQNNLPILIVGQGIAGTLLSFELWQQGIPFVVIDQPDASCASQVSGAVLNPYSGRTIKGISRRSAMYDIATQKYEQIGNMLGTQIVKPAPLLLFGADEATASFDGESVKNLFYGSESVQHFEAVALVENNTLINEWATFLQKNNLLCVCEFEEDKISVDNHRVHYEGATYSKIIFCNGVAAMQSAFFAGLRFTENRGDVLLLKIPDLPEQFVYQKDRVRLLPKGDALFWCGSNYLWSYDNMIPDEAWRQETLQQLNSWLRTPFELQAHLCAKRPTTAGQIPFIGWHPRHPLIGICNGLGTKGFSAGPMWIADFVAESILQQQPTMYQHVLDKWLSF